MVNIAIVGNMDILYMKYYLNVILHCLFTLLIYSFGQNIDYEIFSSNFEISFCH